MQPKNELESINLLDLKPIRLAEWEEAGGRVVLVRPAPTSKRLRRILDTLTFWMSVRRIRLDEVGSFSWVRLDGRHSVREVAAALREEFGEAAEPAEERLGVFVRTLRHQGMLAYPGWDEVPAKGRSPITASSGSGADP